MYLLAVIRGLERFCDDCICGRRFQGRRGNTATYLGYLVLLQRTWRVNRWCGYRRFNHCRGFLRGVLYNGTVKVWQNRLCWTLRRVLRPRRRSCQGSRAGLGSWATRETNGAAYTRVTCYRAYRAWSLSCVHGWAAQTTARARLTCPCQKNNSIIN